MNRMLRELSVLWFCDYNSRTGLRLLFLLFFLVLGRLVNRLVRFPPNAGVPRRMAHVSFLLSLRVLSSTINRRFLADSWLTPFLITTTRFRSMTL